MKKTKFDLSNPAVSISAGAVTAVLSTVLTSLAGALVLSFTGDPARLFGIMSLAALFLSAVIYGIISSKLLKVTPLLSFLSALIALIPMLIAGLIIKAGLISPSVLLNYLAYLGIAVLTSVIAARIGKRRKYY